MQLPPAKPPGYPAQPGWSGAPAPKKENVLGIIGLVCSIAGALGLLAIVVTFGFFFFIGFISLPLSIAGMICGRIGVQKVDRGELPSGRGMSQAAFITGLVGVILHVLAVIIVVVILGLLLGAIDNLEIPDQERRRNFDGPDFQSALLVSAGLALARLSARSGAPSGA